MTNKELWNRIKQDWPDLAQFLLESREYFGKLNNVEVEKWPEVKDDKTSFR